MRPRSSMDTGGVAGGYVAQVGLQSFIRYLSGWPRIRTCRFRQRKFPGYVAGFCAVWPMRTTSIQIVRNRLPGVGSKSEAGEWFSGQVRGLNVIKETILVEVDPEEQPIEVDAQTVEVVEKASKNRRRR
jgi:hypothetical protein